MSRTFRRKGCKPDEWVTRDYDRFIDNDGNFYWRDFQLQGKEREEAIRKYYADGGVGDFWYCNAPAWFKKDIERIRRAKRKAEVRRIVKQSDYEEYEFEPIKKNAGYYW